MEKYKKLIENIKNFFNAGDVKAIFFTLSLIFILIMICKSSSVNAATFEYNGFTFEVDDKAYDTFKTFDEYKSGNYEYVIWRWQDLWRVLFIPKESFSYAKFYMTFSPGNGNLISTCTIKESMRYYRLDKNYNIAYSNLDFRSSVSEYISTGDHSAAIISSFDIYKGSECTILLFDPNQLYKDTNLQLSVSTTETTDSFITIYTQIFDSHFINSHKCYVKYNDTEYLADLSTDGFYYINAIENGTYKFKLTDLDGNVISSSSITITNIISNPEQNVISPILTTTKTDKGTVQVKTQSLNITGVSRIECYYWLGSTGSFDTKIKIEPTVWYSNNTRLIFFMKELIADDTIYFIFYDKILDKYSEISSKKIIISEVAVNPLFPENGEKEPEKTIESLLRQKFGIFYTSIDFLTEFWEVLNEDAPEPPSFKFTIPDFLGGGTFNIFNLELYDKYKEYVHYVIAGFAYFFFIKRMTKTIPALISDIGD